jgi:hypothetical protein
MGFILAYSLPPAIRAAHWPAAWAGLDALEAAGLMATGVALIGRYSWLCLPAAVTSTLLVIDAWFDITTSAPGPATTVAIAMAIFPNSRWQACVRCSPSVTHRAVLSVTGMSGSMNICQGRNVRVRAGG